MMKYLAIILLCATLVSCSEESKTTSMMSPCQCKTSGGCAVMWHVPEGKTYADGTLPKDYDDYGNYFGTAEVPDICRK